MAIFSLHYLAVHGQHPASWPAPDPMHLYHHARVHVLVTLPSGPATAFTPWARLTLMPQALTSAHQQSSITSPQQITQPRRPHQHSSQQPSRDALPTRHDSLRHQQAVAARHEPTMTACSQPARSGSGLALSAPASRAPHRARPLHTSPAPHSSRCHSIATPPVIATCTTGAGRPPRVRTNPSLQGHHSLGSVGTLLSKDTMLTRIGDPKMLGPNPMPNQ